MQLWRARQKNDSIIGNKRKKPTFSREIEYSSKTSCGHAEWSLTTLPEFLRRKTKSFCSCPRVRKKLLRKTSSNYISTLEMQFWRFHQNVAVLVEKWPKIRKCLKNYFFLRQKVFFRKIFLWTRGMHFWQHCQKWFAWSRKKNLDVRKRKKKDFFQNNKHILPQIVLLDT